MLSIGAWAPGLSSIYDSITPGERDAMADLGVHTDMGGAFFDKAGTPVGTPLDARMIVTPGPVLASIPTVLAVAYGAAKSSAVLAVLQGKIVNGLVTHTSLARALLDEARRQTAGHDGG
jgi:DNA-binding transcriptional regulator LsrR (DeoR family)